MEKWKEICEGIIPKGKYLAEVRNGEEAGLVIFTSFYIGSPIFRGFACN